MANISELLKKIKSARYGRDVRDSIHDAIQAMNTDIENNVPTVQSLAERAEGASSSAKTYSTDASAAATNAKNYSDSAKQYSESAASAIARAYDTETTANKHLANTVESPMLVTKATRNLLNPNLQTTTKNGVTCTNNGDGTYTLNGTPSINSTYGFRLLRDISKNIYGGCLFTGATPHTDEYKLYVGYFDDANTWKAEKIVGREGIIIDGSYPRISFEIIFMEGASAANNLVFKPMLTTDLDATYDDFVPYSGYDIKTCGKNLLNPTLATTTQNGVTCTNNGDGTYTLNGTPSINSTYGFRLLRDISKNIYGGCLFTGATPHTDEYKLCVGYFDDANTRKAEKIVGREGIIIDGSYPRISFEIIFMEGASAANNLVFKPMLTTDLNATYDDFESYQDGGTVRIDSTTEFPLLGLKSFNGETNIISPGNVEVSHALTDTGKYVMQNMKDISDIKAAIVA